MNNTAHASSTISNPQNGYLMHKRDYNTDDIIQLMLWGQKRVGAELSDFAKGYEPTVESMRDLFNFLYQNISYKADPPGAQWVKDPRRLWHERIGDCKSFTLFIVSVAKNLGLGYTMRFTSYNWWNATPKHVYPIIILPDGRCIVMDVVYAIQEGGKFNQEKPYQHKVDYMKPKQGLAYLTGTKQQETILDAIADILTDPMMPDSLVEEDDVTEMTEGELQRYLMSERLSTAADQATSYEKKRNLQTAAGVVKAGSMVAVGNISGDMQRPIFDFLQETQRLTQPAFDAPTLRFKSQAEIQAIMAGLGDFFKKVGKGIKNIVNKGVDTAKKVVNTVGSAFKAAWAKLMNFAFKGGLQKASPFFLFRNIKTEVVNKVGGEIQKRAGKQNKVVNFMVKVGMKRNNIEAALGNGIQGIYKTSAKNVINRVAGRKIAGTAMVGDPITFAAVAKIVGTVISLIGGLKKLFKKDDAPEVSENDHSELALLEDLPDFPPPGGSSSPSSTSRPSRSAQYPADYQGAGPSGGGGNNMILIGLGLIGASFFLARPKS
jgi:hypothetical protein